MARLSAYLIAPVLLPLAACGGGGSAVTDSNLTATNTSVVPVSSAPFQASTAVVTGSSEDFASSLNPSNQFTELSFDPDDLDNVTLSASVPVGETIVTVAADFSKIDIVSEDARSVIYRQDLDSTTIVQLSLVKPENNVDRLSYSSFGYWLVDDSNVLELTQTHFAYGILSTAEQLDIMGTATYSGLVEGHRLSADEQRGYISGEIALEADFGTRAMSGLMSGLTSTDNLSGDVTELSDMDFAGRIFGGENRFQGSLSNEDNSASGDLLGHFYGPSELGEAPPEAAGTWRFGSSGEQAVGAFGARLAAD